MARHLGVRTTRVRRTYWLERAPIEWHGDAQFVERWGRDHPLCQPIQPTRLLLILASSTTPAFSIRLDRDWSIPPATPVLNDATTVQDAEPAVGLGMKVAIRQSTR